jgi:predicted nuclease of predicted toxin-antitoxin system
MKLWLDAQLSPALAAWLRQQIRVEVTAVRDLGLRDALDPEIFLAARRASAVVMTKDGDFSALIERHGAPPQVIWLRCGNTSNTYLKQLLVRALPQVLALLEGGEPLVEISETW